MSRSDKSALLLFYSGTGPDHRGRYLRDILAWNDVQLESTHDYIQWLFPTDERSAFNRYAPVLAARDIAEFHSSANLRSRLRDAFTRMLQFYGFEIGVDRIRRGENWETQSANWLQPGNHNHLRITRILTSLRLLGCRELAVTFLAALEQLQDYEAISGETLRFWRNAIEEPGIRK